MTTIERHVLLDILLGLLQDNYWVVSLEKFTKELTDFLGNEDNLIVSKAIRILLKICSDKEKASFIQRAFKCINLFPETEQRELIDLCVILIS